MSEPDAQPATDLAARVAELEAELAELRERIRLDRRQAERETHLRVERIRTLSNELRDTRKELNLERRRHGDLRRRRAVRLSLAVADRLRPAIRAAGTARAALRRARGGDEGPQDEPGRVLRATRAEEAAMRARLATVLATPGPATGPLVSIIVVTRDGAGHLRRLLPSLETLEYRDLELIVVDNGSTDSTPAVVGGHSGRIPLRLIRNATNRTFSEANNQGVAESKGELILLLNNDVTPAGPHVVGRMVERLTTDPTIGAVGSRLIYPRRQGPRMGPAHHPVDLTLQHRGITFDADDGIPRGRNLGAGEDPLGQAAAEPRDVAAATAASFLVRRSAFDAVGGFSLGYVYGTEDVDLSLKLRAAGHRIVYEPSATFWHDESATQHRQERESRLMRQQQNRELFVDQWGPRIFREVFLDRLLGRLAWSEVPLHVAITLTRDEPEAGWGDWYTAHELGAALAGLGWRVSYLERYQDRWYDPDPSIDVVVSLLDALDVRRLPESMVTVAWIRNWTDRWLGHAWFDEYDVVLASSETSRRLVEAGSTRSASLFPLATNPDRFRPHPPLEPSEERASGPTTGVVDDEGRRSRSSIRRDEGARPGGPTTPPEQVDVAFVGNHWGEERAIQATLSLLRAAGRSVALHGRGWSDVAEVSDIARGPVSYDVVPDVYRSARIVLDDTASPTLPYGAVNSRVFDALAAGTLVVTDNPVGVRELFGDAVPAATTPEALSAAVAHYLDHPDERAARVEQLRAIVLDRHTYAHRAEELRATLAAWADALHVDIAIGPPGWDVAESWGDYHFGRAVQRQLERHGIRSRVHLKSGWDGRAIARADVVVQVFGLLPRRTHQGQVSALWVISHPELVGDELVDGNDVLFAASDSFAEHLAERTGRPVASLHQATDPDRFQPAPGGIHHELLFVANSRGVRRRIVDELTPTDRDLAVYGKGWTADLLDPRHLRGEHIPNDELAPVYAAASIVLNDHWPDMAERGFLSNRLYDASAAGAFVITDRVPGLEAEFDGGIPSFQDGEELRGLIERFLADPEARREHAGRARRAVLARHTFAHRVDRLLEVVGPLLEGRPRRIVEDSGGDPASDGPGAPAS
jgi:GT2 family glycosyltransferase/spore maturation protein CgeB